MAQSEPPKGHVSLRVPTGVLWTAGIAVVAYLIQLSFSLHADLVKEQERVGAYEARFKQLEDRRASCESRLDESGHRIERLEQKLTIR